MGITPENSVTGDNAQSGRAKKFPIHFTPSENVPVVLTADEVLTQLNSMGQAGCCSE